MPSPDPDPDKRATIARIAASTRWDTKSPELTDAHRALAAESLEQHVRKVVAAAPPLTAEQRDRIAAILRQGGTAA